MDTEKIRKLTSALDDATKVAAALRKEAAQLRLDHGGDICVNVPGATRNIFVATNGGREAGWMTRMVRGREMIMLGIKKAYAAMIQEADARVNDLKESIAREVRP